MTNKELIVPESITKDWEEKINKIKRHIEDKENGLLESQTKRDRIKYFLDTVGICFKGYWVELKEDEESPSLIINNNPPTEEDLKALEEWEIIKINKTKMKERFMSSGCSYFVPTIGIPPTDYKNDFERWLKENKSEITIETATVEDHNEYLIFQLSKI